MFVFTNLLDAVAQLLSAILDLYFWVVVIAAGMSWFSPDPYNPIVRILHALTEPVFYRVRKWLPFLYVNGVDLSPIAVLLVIKFIQVAVVRTLMQYAMTL